MCFNQIYSIKKNYFKRYIKLLIRCFRTNKTLDKNFFQFEKTCDPLALFEHKIDVMKAYCENKKIKMVHVLQPNLFYKKKLSKTEKKYLNFWIQNSTSAFDEKKLRSHYEKLKSTYFYLKQNNIKSMKYFTLYLLNLI